MSFLLKKIGFQEQLLYIGLLWLLTIAFGLAVSMRRFLTAKSGVVRYATANAPYKSGVVRYATANAPYK